MLNEYRLILTLAIIPVLITVACSSDTPTAAPPATSTEVIENALPVPPATATQAPTATPVPTGDTANFRNPVHQPGACP